MAGIYLHIPFCRSACTYCNFYFTVNQSRVSSFINAIQTEIQARYHELNEPIETIYFGGGTPSILNAIQIESILNQVFNFFIVEKDAEITLEANPEDVTLEACNQFLSLKINRLSLGIQSFSDTVLRNLNRSHTAAAAEKALDTALSAGFKSVSADIIYGIPSYDADSFQKTVALLLQMEVPHISAYALTVEHKTKLSLDISRNHFPAISEDQQVFECNYLNSKLTESDYDRYEISNYSKAGHYSRHNTGYWERKPYLGLGPSAHSFIGQQRSWNITPLSEYIRAAQDPASMIAGYEILHGNTLWNDFVLTKLRTKRGFSWQETKLFFPTDVIQQQLSPNIESFRKRGWIQPDLEKVALTAEGFHFADKITATLFL